jgi:mannose-6-phosphate isomerase-like protein (cupin superfamily)
VIVIPKFSAKKSLDFEGKHLELLFKSGKMEGIMIEIDVDGEFGKKYKHDGEELHIMIEGVIEYMIGDDIYKLKEGDSLWHKSNLPHTARNIGDKKARYITIGVPPTFM